MFGVDTLESFGAFSRAEIAAAGALIDYVERTQIGKTPHLEKPRQISSGDTLEIDAATRANLELTRTLSGTRKGSLLETIDRTVTGPGARLLQSYIAAPLTNLEAINARLDRITYLKDDPSLNDILRDLLKATPDMERALARLLRPIRFKSQYQRRDQPYRCPRNPAIRSLAEQLHRFIE